MTQLGNGLSEANHHEEALCVQEAELSMRRRQLDVSEAELLDVQSNLAITYSRLGRDERALEIEGPSRKARGGRNQGKRKQIKNPEDKKYYI